MDPHKHACDTCERTFSCSGVRVGFACPAFKDRGFRCPDCWGDYVRVVDAHLRLSAKAEGKLA
jgi:hypothetical protein